MGEILLEQRPEMLGQFPFAASAIVGAAWSHEQPVGPALDLEFPTAQELPEPCVVAPST